MALEYEAFLDFKLVSYIGTSLDACNLRQLMHRQYLDSIDFRLFEIRGHGWLAVKKRRLVGLIGRLI